MSRKGKSAIVNGEMLPASQAMVSIADRGFRYGDGIFETIAVHGGVPCQFDWHLSRLGNGLKAIKIPFDTGVLRGHCRKLLKASGSGDGILRIQVTRGIGSRGYLPKPCPATFVIETLDMPASPTEPVALWQSSYAKISDRALPVRYKLCQGLNSTLARLEAAENQCFDAVLLNERGQLCETSSASLFWFKGGALYTPSLDCGILEGATRAAILRLSPYPVHEAEAGMEALHEADAVFIANTVWQALAVHQLLPSGERWSSEEIAQQLRQLLGEDREDYCQAHGHEWLAENDS